MTKLSMNSPEETRRLSITLLFCCDVKKKIDCNSPSSERCRSPSQGICVFCRLQFMSDGQNVNQFKGKNL